MVTNEDLIEWAGKQHCWVSDAIKTFYENGKFEEEDVVRFADECLLEQAGEARRSDLSGLNLLQHGKQGSLSLCSISNVEGVNAYDCQFETEPRADLILSHLTLV